MSRVHRATTMLFALLVLGRATSAAGSGLPAGFALDAIGGPNPWDIPTAIAFAPDGRLFVAEKDGRVWVVEHGVRRGTPVWDGRDVVLSNGDRGLTGLAVDPDFLVNHRLYFAYTMDPDVDGVDDEDVAFGGIVRATMSLADTNVVDPGSLVTLIGEDWTEGVLNAGAVHTIDALRWGADGSLLASMGDGALYLSYDRGGATPGLFMPGRGDALEDLGQFRAQSLLSYGGKLLRLDPATGAGLPDNPFWDGDSSSHRSRVWAYGFRNPWRFAVRPGTAPMDSLGAPTGPGQLIVGDVGLNAWESVFAVGPGGMNAGWPCWDGVDSVALTRLAPPARCPCDSTSAENPLPRTAPVAWLHHNDPQRSQPAGWIGNSLTLGEFYAGTRYPAPWSGRLFLGDYGQQWIRAAELDSSGHIVALEPFLELAAGPVDFAADPVTGDLHYIALYENQVRRIRYTEPGNQPPVPSWVVDSLVGAAPFVVHADASGSTDPDADAFTARWDFGDGHAHAGPSAVHVLTQPGHYTLVLTLEDVRGAVRRETTAVTVFEAPTYPTTPTLDAFSGPEPEFSEEWRISPFGVALREGRLEAISPGTWALRDSVFASAVQESYTRLTHLAAQGHAGVLLKAQGPDPALGALRVLFDAVDSLALVQSIVPGGGWTTHATLAAPQLVPGMSVGARATPGGEIQVFADGLEFGRARVPGWPAHAAGGRIGLAFEGALGDTAAVDDFGGGDAVLGANGAPTLSVTAPADSGFYAAGDTIPLAAEVTDDRDPADSLRVHWFVDLRHNNHLHPAIAVFEGPLATFVAGEHEDGTGTSYRIRTEVADAGGLVARSQRVLHPDVDLAPIALAHAPDTLDDLHGITWTATFANHGRMESPWSRWRLVSRSPAGAVTLLAEGDIEPAAAETTVVTFTTGPIVPPGPTEFRLVADSLAAVREPDEVNNALWHAEHVVARVNDVPTPPRLTALGPPHPNPWRDAVSLVFTLAEPTPPGAGVRMRLFDVAGREVWGRDLGAQPAGSLVLRWDGRDRRGRRLDPGLYFARIEAGRRVFNARLVRLP